jgi:Zn-dependent protease with chaperone function
MDRDEVMFVLGHEMGHIRLRHYAIQTVLGSPGAGVPWIVYLPLLAFRVLFLRGKLSRSMEYSADRAGLIACGSLENAVSTMIKLGSGKWVAPEQVKGVIDGRMKIDGDRGLLAEILSTHPDLDDRVKELVRFGRDDL